MAIDDEETAKKNSVHKFLDNSKVQLFLLIITIYALFADDYRTLTTKPDMDIVFDIFVIAITTIFAVEIFLASVWKPGFFNSYYFYLDIVSTMSLLLDFSPVRTQLVLFR